MQLQSQPKFRYFARNGQGGEACHSIAGYAYVGRLQRACMHPSTVCHARLPHLDEEIEHMQWQLGKRSLERGSDTRHSNSHRHSAGNHNQGRASSNSSSRGGKGRKHQHVFHERHVSRHNHVHHHQLHHNHHSSTGSSGGTSSENELAMPAQGNSAAAADQVPAAAHDALQALDTTAPQQQDVSQLHQQQQQRHQRHAQQQQQQQQHGYYHMQLPLQAAALDLPKAKERLSKHIMQDGGCYVAAAAAQSSMLTHLLLSLQHKQAQEQPGSVLLLQPVNISTALSAAAVRVPQEYEWSGSPGAAFVVGGDRQQGGSSCTEQLDFWLTAMPLDMLLGLMQEQQETVRVGGDGGIGKPRGNSSSSSSSMSSSVASASSMSLLDGSFSFSMDSSSEDWQSSSSSSNASSSAAYITITSTGRAGNSSTAAVSITSSSMTTSRSADKHSKRDSSSSSAEEALLHAAARSCPASGALLLQALSEAALKCVRVGSHADVHTVASSMVRAVAAGRVESLHVKGHAGAHSIAYTALVMAATKLSVGLSPKGFGVLLVPGEEREHVHAVLQGHTGAAQDGLGVEHQHAARVADDASMSVRGIGAAFYGIGDSSSSSSGSRGGDHGLLHKHAQEMWLCVVPLSLG